MARRYEIPRTPSEAVKKWGKSATVSINMAQLREDMQVLMTFEKPPKDRYAVTMTMFGESEPPVGVRFSGNPDALHDMFRALHIEYAKRKGRYAHGTGRRRTIIIDPEEEQNGD